MKGPITREEFDQAVRRAVLQDLGVLRSYREVLAYPRERAGRGGYFRLYVRGFPFGTLLSERDIMEHAPPLFRRIWSRRRGPE